MKIALIDIDKFIKLNEIKEVTNPVLCEKGAIPTVDGLLSTELFGVSGKERERTFGYMDLGGYYLHPFIFKRIKRIERKIEHIVAGTKTFIINDKGRLEENENGGTGLEWLYKNWDKISWDNGSESNLRKETVSLLSGLNKSQIFVSKFLILPAFYRDMNLGSSEMSHDKINDAYSRILRLVQLTKNANNFAFVLYSTQSSVQQKLVDIYDYFKIKLEKKNGIMRKSLLGKSIDYCARLVISAPKFNTNTPEEMEVSLTHSGLPLAYTISCFYPFIQFELKNYLKKLYSKFGSTYEVNGVRYEVDVDWIEDAEELKKKIIDKFLFSHQDRFFKVEIRLKNYDGPPVYFKFEATDIKTGKPVIRDLSYADILYQCAVEVVSDKHIIITRYPVLDYFGSFISKINVTTTNNTLKLNIAGKEYNNYPLIDFSLSPEKIAIAFVGTLTMCNLYLGGLGGDYDGDQVTVKSLFSQESNIEADRLMKQVSNFISIEGKSVKTSTNEAVQTLYQLTMKY